MCAEQRGSEQERGRHGDKHAGGGHPGGEPAGHVQGEVGGAHPVHHPAGIVPAVRRVDDDALAAEARPGVAAPISTPA